MWTQNAVGRSSVMNGREPGGLTRQLPWQATENHDNTKTETFSGKSMHTVGYFHGGRTVESIEC
jgi:hypothetical protein